MASMKPGTRIIARDQDHRREYLGTVVSVSLVDGMAEVKMDMDRDTTRIALDALEIKKD